MGNCISIRSRPAESCTHGNRKETCKICHEVLQPLVSEAPGDQSKLKRVIAGLPANQPKPEDKDRGPKEVDYLSWLACG